MLVSVAVTEKVGVRETVGVTLYVDEPVAEYVDEGVTEYVPDRVGDSDTDGLVLAVGVRDVVDEYVAE